MLFSYIICAIVSFTTIWWLWLTSTRFWKLCSLIPGPKPLPLIGNIHQVLSSRKLFLINFFKFAEMYFPICRVFIGPTCFVVLQDADDIHNVLYSNEAISKAISYDIVGRIIGHSVLTVPRDPWKKYRRIMNPGFSTKTIRSFVSIFDKKCSLLLVKLESKATGRKFDILNDVSMMTMDAICETSLGTDMKIQENKLDELVSKFKGAKDIVDECLLSPWYWIQYIYRHSKLYKYMLTVHEAGNKIIRAIIDRKIKYYTEKQDISAHFNEESTNNMPVSFLDYAFRFMNENQEKLSKEEIEDQVRILLIAGTDTTAFTICVCLMLLGIYKDVQDNIVNELVNIFNHDKHRPIHFEDIQRMTYMEQVIKETLRLFPVAFIAGRKADEDVQVNGFTIPAGTNIIISPYLLHRNSKYFPDPLKFDPNRFSPENLNHHPHSFIPFLAGTRNCIGHYYAMCQMKIVLSHILRRFEIFPCSSREEIEDIDLKMLLSLKHGYNVRMKARKSETIVTGRV